MLAAGIREPSASQHATTHTASSSPLLVLCSSFGEPLAYYEVRSRILSKAKPIHSIHIMYLFKLEEINKRTNTMVTN
jgi:hypothetical protein